MKPKPFSFEHYYNTLQKAKESGYKFLQCKEFAQIKNYEKVIILRHDVDFCLENSLVFSKLETSLGIKSTYFIRLHSRRYNPLDIKNYKIVQNIISQGHEIGLHHEPDFTNFCLNGGFSSIKDEINCFNTLFQTKIHGVSTHEPTRNAIQISPDNLHNFPLKYEAYFPHFIKDMKYISDSGSRWREGCMSEWIAKGEPKLCIVTHPGWWYEKSSLENY